MGNEILLYSQLLGFHDRNHFNYLVRKYEGDKHVKNFTCYKQLPVLMYGQPSNRESLRDVVFAAQALEDKASVSASESMCPEALLRMRITSGINTSLNSLHITP